MRTVFALAFLVACGNSLRDDRFPTGSSTVAIVDGHAVAAVVNVDEGTVSFAGLADGSLEEVPVGDAPTRIARVGDELWVTLKAERAVAVLARDEAGHWVRSGRIPVGVEPHGIVASEDGRRVYVANTLSDTVLELDGRSRERLRSFPVQDQPRFLALHPNGDRLFVASTLHGTLSSIDLRSGEVSEFELPATIRNTPEGEVSLDGRNTGDIAISPDGTTLAVPVLYADTTTSVEEPENPDEPVIDGYGSSIGVSVGRINPALVTWDLGMDGAPEGEGVAVFLAASTFLELDGSLLPTFRSYPTSVTASPDDESWYVTMESSNAVVVVPTAMPDAFSGGDTEVDFASPGTVGTATAPDGRPLMPFTDPTAAGFEVRSTVVVATAVGPKAVAFDGEDQAVVHAWLERTLESVPVDAVEERLGRLDDGDFVENLVSARGTRRLTTSALPAEVEDGRRLFFSALDQRMAAQNAGVSCSTCHLDGRNDGFTWTLRGEQRNTPSLAGPVQETAPVTWSEAVPTVADEAMLTTSIRMGGAGLAPRDAAAIEAFIQFGRYPDVPRRGERSALVEQGRAIFEREDVGCASCHSGEYFTDTTRHPIFGAVPTETPTLRGIAASRPYLHDGSAPTLEAVVDYARSGAMGDTSMLSAGERKALVAYLESL